MIFGGFIFLGGVLTGGVGTILGMSGSFSSLGQEGVADPRGLAEFVGLTLWSMLGGLVAAAIGTIVFLVGLVLLITEKYGKSS